MDDVLINVLAIIITVIVLPLLTLAGIYLIKFINSKIGNSTAARLLTEVSTIVLNAVRSVFQTYVETLKKNGKFDAESQKVALQRAKEIALAQLDDEKKEFITKTFGDLEVWITTQIESSIHLLKNK